MTDPHTARVLEIADHLHAPAQDALCDLARTLSPVDQLGQGLVEHAPDLGVSHQHGHQPVDGLGDRLEAAGGTT